MSRLGVAVGVAVGLALAVPGARASQGAVPVEGGGSFNDAPLLTPGTYSDTIQLSETLFYAIELTEGQRLVVSATLVGQPAGPSLGAGHLRATLFSPTRQKDVLGSQVEFLDARKDGTVEVDGDVVGSSSTRYDRPGRYYVALEFGAPPEQGVRDFELRIVLQAVQEGPLPTTTTTPASTTSSPPGSSTATTASAEEARDGEGDGLSVGAATASFALGTIGGGGAYWARWRLRRRATPPADQPGATSPPSGGGAPGPLP